MYGVFLRRLGELYHPERIKGQCTFAVRSRRAFHAFHLDGQFGAMMNVSLTNEVSSQYRARLRSEMNKLSGPRYVHS